MRVNIALILMFAACGGILCSARHLVRMDHTNDSMVVPLGLRDREQVGGDVSQQATAA